MHFARSESHVWVFSLNYIGKTRPDRHLGVSNKDAL
jgi:hypothetical protein